MGGQDKQALRVDVPQQTAHSPLFSRLLFECADRIAREMDASGKREDPHSPLPPPRALLASLALSFGCVNTEAVKSLFHHSVYICAPLSMSLAFNSV